MTIMAPADARTLTARLILLRRLAAGVTSHWRERRADWMGAWFVLGFGGVLVLGPYIFEHDPRAFTYAYMHRLADQPVWAWACIALGACRFTALFVNGTFPKFRWSPMLRMVGAGLTCFVWLQAFMGVWLHSTWSTAQSMYLGLLILDVLNCYDAILET